MYRTMTGEEKCLWTFAWQILHAVVKMYQGFVMDDALKKLTIIKSSGSTEPFSLEKYHRSLRRTGVPEEKIQEILVQLQPIIHDRMTTHELYSKTYQLLRNKQAALASRYSLKNALRLLGPSGFPFEQLIAKLLHVEGYAVKRNVIMQGRCVSHEIDVVAEQNHTVMIVECKFHNRVGLKSDVRIPLYTKARYDDIVATKPATPVTHCMLATNTQFTSDAIEYGTCVALRMLAWGFPLNEGLEILIERFGLYPITVLTNLRARDRAILLHEGILLCTDLIEQKHQLASMGLSKNTVDRLIEETRALCASNGPGGHSVL
jgi:hypothetical protein